MPVNRSSNRVQPHIPVLESPLFSRVLETPPTKMQCMAALSEIPNQTPNLKGKKSTKVPLISWTILGLGMVSMPSIGSDGLNPAPAILLILGAIGKSVASMHVNSMQNLRIKEYIKALEVFMSNCNVHISVEDRARIQAQIDSVKKLTNVSYAAHLKDTKSQKTRSQSSAQNGMPSAAVNVRAVQKTKPAVSTAPTRVQLPPPSFKLPAVSIPNMRAPTTEEVSDGIGNAAKGLFLFGAAVVSLGAAAFSH